MQPADITRIVSVSAPRVSPDGERVAFVVTRVDREANRYRSAIWIAAVDGSAAPRALTSGEHADRSPVWSPGGDRLAFARTAGEEHRLCVLPVDGAGETVVVCVRDEAIEEPAWSPTGDRIAFASRVRAARFAEGDDERARPPRRIDRLVARLDGEGWTVDRPTGVFVVAADGPGVPELVLDGPYDHGGPVWSPDGTRLAVCAPRRPDADLTHLHDLYVVEPGGEPRRVGTAELSHALPSWSPDGTRIATLTEDVLLVPSHGQVMVTDVATGAETIVSATLDRQCLPYPGARAPVWRGAELLFSVEDHGEVHVCRVPADGSAAPTREVDGSVVTAFDAAGGTVAFVAGTPTTLPELHVRTADGTERQLTHLGAPFGAAVPALAPERFTVDGIDAWILRPAEPAGERTPVLLSIHGGPMTQYTDAWFDEFQLWAAAGYAVVYGNPRGSTGGTQEWMREIRSPQSAVHPGSGWAGRAAEDVLAVLDAALERDPSLDPDRVGVLGGSYGGYLTTWLVAHTDRFAAACSERAANNLEALEWDSDFGGLFHHEIGVSHLDAPEVYRGMSPVEAVRDIDAPMLLLHSEDDLRCRPGQADQLFVALRLLGKPVEYWLFPEEGHELSRTGSPRHRVQRAEIILDWFGRHLGGRRPTITWDHPSRA